MTLLPLNSVSFFFTAILLMTSFVEADNVAAPSQETQEDYTQAPLDYLDGETALERETKPFLVNAAFGMGKNFHAFRAGVAYSPMKMPEGYEKWDFYVELAFYILQRHCYSPKKLYIATITPFTRYHFAHDHYLDPYWDIGVGGAYRDKTCFGNIPISTNLSFHIMTSFGLHPFGKEGPSLSIRWYHFSNARIKLPNHGIDIHFNVALEYAF